MMIESNSGDFKIVTVGYGYELINHLWNRLQKETGLSFYHILHPSLYIKDTENHSGKAGNCYFVFNAPTTKIEDSQDREYLASLEISGVPTINNMIMGDRVVKQLEYKEAIAYASFLVRRMESLFNQIQPSIVIGGFDGIHSGIGLAVAKKLKIPWYAFHYTTIPKGLTGFCTGMNPDTVISPKRMSSEVLRMMAEKTLKEFENKSLSVPAYASANSVAAIVHRMPKHIEKFYKMVNKRIKWKESKYTQYNLGYLAKEYLRKRRNILLLPKSRFVNLPPKNPYVFIGLHRQPEASIDIWSPYYSDQLHLIEMLSRSTPPTHKVLVKLHMSDADNYSRSQLERYRRLPGVEIVSPFVQSRKFIEQASLIVAIQGNIALEAALLGKPVLVFGDTKFVEMPSISKVKRITDLPKQIRKKLTEKKPTRERILKGIELYASNFGLGCYNDWNIPLSELEIANLAKQLVSLKKHVAESK